LMMIVDRLASTIYIKDGAQSIASHCRYITRIAILISQMAHKKSNLPLLMKCLSKLSLNQPYAV
jgi:hypothetical protein